MPKESRRMRVVNLLVDGAGVPTLWWRVGNIIHIMWLHLEFISVIFDEYKSRSVNYETCARYLCWQVVALCPFYCPVAPVPGLLCRIAVSFAVSLELPRCWRGPKNSEVENIQDTKKRWSVIGLACASLLSIQPLLHQDIVQVYAPPAGVLTCWTSGTRYLEDTHVSWCLFAKMHIGTLACAGIKMHFYAWPWSWYCYSWREVLIESAWWYWWGRIDWRRHRK